MESLDSAGDFLRKREKSRNGLYKSIKIWYNKGNSESEEAQQMDRRVWVIVALLFLILFAVQFCRDTAPETNSFDSVYEESQKETSTYDNSDSVVTRKREYSFPEYNSDTDEIDDAYEGADYDDYDADWYDDYNE